MRERSEKSRAPIKGTHLLAGLIFCGECGARMRYVKWGKNGYSILYASWRVFRCFCKAKDGRFADEENSNMQPDNAEFRSQSVLHIVYYMRASGFARYLSKSILSDR